MLTSFLMKRIRRKHRALWEAWRLDEIPEEE